MFILSAIFFVTIFSILMGYITSEYENKKSLIISVKRVSPFGILPEKNYQNDAAFDIRCSTNGFVFPKDRVLIKTGIAMKIPQGYYGQIVGRSGLAKTNGVIILGGVIDADYRGEIMVMVYNSSIQNDFIYKAGDKIAQMVILPVPKVKMMMVETLDETERGSQGFGSSGK